MENFVTTIWKDARKRDRKCERKDGGNAKGAEVGSLFEEVDLFSLSFFLFSFLFFPSFLVKERKREEKINEYSEAEQR